MDMRADAKLIYTRAIDAALPDNAVKVDLKDIELQGNIYVAAVGKAAWRMGKTVSEVLGSRIKAGIVVTKRGYGKGAIALRSMRQGTLCRMTTAMPQLRRCWSW